MSVFPNTCWKMTQVAYCGNNKEWYEMSSFVNIWIVIGKKYGMLYIQPMCSCGYDFSFEDYFFTTGEYDHIFRTCMIPSFDGKKMRIYLPNGDQGSFEMISNSDGFNDDYILQVISRIDWKDKKEFTKDLFFETLCNQIRMRTMFKKFYFRCFRKAFKPGKNQANWALKYYDNILHI